MKQVLNYNIHNILTLQIVRERKKDLLKDLNLEFSYFETNDEIFDPDIILNIGKFKPSNEKCYVVDHKYYIKDNYLYCKDSDSGAKWEVEINGFEKGKTEINFYSNIFGIQSILIPEFLPQNLLVRPLIEYKLAKKGYFLIHSGAVSKDNQAFLLEGRGGAFKTTLAMDFVRRQKFEFLADDRVIIYKDNVMSFPIHYKLFEFRVEHLQNEELKGFWNKITLIKYLRNSRHGDPVDNRTISSLKAIFSIIKTNKEKISISELNTKVITEKLITSMKVEMVNSPMMMGLDFGRYFNYMQAYSFIFPYSKIATYWDDLKDDMLHVFEGIPIYLVEIPLKYDVRVFEYLNSIAEGIR